MQTKRVPEGLQIGFRTYEEALAFLKKLADEDTFQLTRVVDTTFDGAVLGWFVQKKQS